MPKKYKPCEIYKRICNMYGEACFSPKNFANELKKDLPLRGRVKKIVQVMETHKLCRKENVPNTAPSKESHADNLLRRERTNITPSPRD